MYKYKIGDKVFVKKNNNYFGRTGLITDRSRFMDDEECIICTYRIEIVGFNNIGLWFREEELSPVPHIYPR